MSRAMKAVPFVALFLLIIVVPSVGAKWVQDGVALCTVPGSQQSPQITSDGAGGAIVTWEDERSDLGDIYAQRVNASGVVEWRTDGVPICTATGGQYYPTIISDGAGGAIITWQDARSGNNDIYAQRVNASGSVQWTTDGVALCTAARNQWSPTIASDGAGGAMVTWIDSRSVSNYDIYAQRVNASGAVQWVTDGVALCAAAGNQSHPTITSDGAGGAIVTWEDYRGADSDVYAQRVNASGGVQWAADGVALCTATSYQYVPQIASDGAGGAIVTWWDDRGGSNWDIYAQRVNASGAVQWTTDGVALCTAMGTQNYPEITSDGAGGAIVAWADYRGADSDVYAQRVNASGSVQWTADGVALCTATGDQDSPTVVSDGADGAIVTWMDGRSGSNNDVYSQRVNASGAVQWSADGVAVCTATGSQNYPVITSNGAGGALVTWQDYRSGTSWDIYGQWVAADGSVAHLHLDSPSGGEQWKVGSQQAITWTIQGVTPDSVSIFLSINSGVNYDRTVAHGLPGTSTSYSWTVPNLPVLTARILVVVYEDGTVWRSDMSDADFTIKGPPHRYVKRTGANVYPYSIPEWAARNIQDAVNAAVAGDSIFVARETYTSPLIVNKAIYLFGGWDTTFTARDPKTYVTKLQSPGSVVSFMNIPTGTCGVEGFTLKNGSGTFTPMPGNGVYGGGILSYQSSPIIKDNIIDSCGVATVLDYSAGGAIACFGGTPVIEGNTITSGNAQSGGGIYLYQSTATIQNNHIIDCYPNAEYNGTRNGGGVYALHAKATFEGNRIENNDGYKKGAGVYLYLSPASFERDTIALNDGGDVGGGICADRSALTIAHSLLRQNTSGSMGGGIYDKAGNLVITNSILAQNHAAIIGGGIYADSCRGGVTNNTFDRNRATYGGGNIYLAAVPSLNFRNNLVTYGGKNGFQAASMSNVTFRFNNCFGNTPLDVVTTPAVDSTNTSRNPFYADTTFYDYHLLVNSGGIDTGDPTGSADPDGSRADQGAFGGAAALKAAPDYVRNLTATAANDTTISLGWDGLPSGATSYAVYGSPTNNFLPDASVYLGSVSVPGVAFLHHPVIGCRYYRVSAANAAGYGGGYSNQATACAAGPDLIPPTVTVIYPNGHEILEVADTIRIDWHATDNVRVDSVSIYYSVNAGQAYTRIAHGWRADSAYAWIVPSARSDSCLVKVVAYDPGRLTGFDTSDSLFSIKDRTGVHDKGNGDNGGTPRYVTALEQNFPNPFNGTTTIPYSIAERCRVELTIFDPAGRAIAVLERLDRQPGRYATAIWDGKDGAGRGVASGVYFCRIKAGKFRQTRKILYLR